MNIITGKQPLAEFTGFKGLWSRGAYDTCPPDHLIDCHNCAFPGPGQLTIREPVSVSYYNPGRNIISYFVANNATTGPVLLTLSSTVGWQGLWAELPVPVLLGNSFGSGTQFPDDFTAINIYGRTYISFKYQGKALPGGYLFYWDGVYFVACATAGPGVAVPTLNQANAGIVDAGWHGVAVSFLYRNGNMSQPSTVVTINSVGFKDIELTAIPTSLSPNVVGRVLLMTQVNTSAALAQKATLYFVPDGVIRDGTTTAGVIDSPDLALIASADYLYDLYAPLPSGPNFLPSCSALRFYKGRLVLIGPDVYPDNILVSNQLDPETVNGVTGIVNLPADYTGNSSNTGFVINDVLYPLKPNGTFSVQDNGGDPSTWPVSVIDSALGAWDNAVTLFSSTMSGSDMSGLSFVATRKGLMTFNGSYSQLPLTYKIEDLWRLINPKHFWKIQIAHDAWLKRVYIAVPLYPPAYYGNCSTYGYQFFPLNDIKCFPGMVGMQVNIGTPGTAYTVLSVDPTLSFATLETNAGVQNNVPWSAEYPGQPLTTSGLANLHLILMMDYSDGLDPSLVKWSTWSSFAFEPGISKMSMENYSITATNEPLYQLSFCTGSSTIYKITKALTSLVVGPSHIDNGDSFASGLPYRPINQYFATPFTGGSDGVFIFTMLNMRLCGYGHVYPSILLRNKNSQSFLRSFDLSNYTPTQLDLQRLINITSESISVMLQCDQKLLGYSNGLVQPTKIAVYGNKMWSMRPALVEQY